ncbi:MAG: GNAT family N-acetyltransferase [Streptosporangiaceae bacterium]
MTAAGVYALLADGTTVEIRPAGPEDFDAVKAMHAAMSPDNTYMRFFNMSRLAAETEARRVAKPPEPGRAALLALLNAPGAGPEVVGVASYAQEHDKPNGRAEIAFAVAENMHHRGIATLLLEHLVSYARAQGITTFVANTLTENQAMLNVFSDAGLPVTRRFTEGTYELTFPLPDAGAGTALDSYLNATAERERRAEAASLRHVLAPESVVVIGASRRPGTAGRAILDNLRAAGYTGRLYVVNAHAAQAGTQIAGLAALASPADLPEPVDLAVIAVPAPEVLDAAEACGRRGVRALVVITDDLDADGHAGLLATCRQHGMRLVGPNCFGVAVPGLGLNATFAAACPQPGVAGLVVQSGGLGFAMMDQLSRLGLGISSFASVGDKLDVSSNDMLLWWEHDGQTKLAVLYIESFGNPRKFARTARRVSMTMPVLTVLAGPHAPLAQALFEQAGVITVHGFGELIEATALVATQPIPAGTCVGIVSNVGGAGQLAVRACAGLGLTAHGPVETRVTVSAADFRRCLEEVGARDDVNALIALVLPTSATGDLVDAIAAADVDVPLAAVLLNQPESVRLLDAPHGSAPKSSASKGSVPVYGDPEAAVAAMARAAGYGVWRAEPRGRLPAFTDISPAAARALLAGFLGQHPEGGTLPPETAAELLRLYGIALADDEDLPPGAEVMVQVSADPTFGPLIRFGLGGPSAELLADRSARLTPLTDADADKLIRSIRSLPLLTERGADLDAVAGLVLRVARLADDLPEVTGLELNPVIAGPHGTAVVNARVSVAPTQARDPYLRRLR